MDENQLKTGEKQVRNEKGQFVEGVSANPEGRPTGSKNKFSMAKLEKAMEDVEKELNKDIFKRFVEMSFYNPGLMIALMRKFVPDKSSQEISGIDAINFNINHVGHGNRD